MGIEREVGILGGGISGLLACKYMLEKGFHPIVFEAQSNIGGVWTKTLTSTKLQTPKALYQFSDFGWPSSVTDDFPDHHQVLDYITSYAHHFDLLRHINFNTKVEQIHFQGSSQQEMQAWHLWNGTGHPFSSKGKWKLSLRNTLNHQLTQEYEVDFVILCIGRFSDVPNIPKFGPNRGPEVFGGNVIHSIDYSSMDYQTLFDFVKGKQIIIIGSQKSALDIAMECSEINGVEHPCRVLYRTKHWHIPDFVPWGVPLALLYLNRFSELMLHKPGQGFLLTLLATILSPLRWAFSKFVESHIKWKLGLAKFGMVPKHEFPLEMSSCLPSVLPEKFYDKVQEGTIILKKAPSFWFTQEGVLVDGEAEPLKTFLHHPLSETSLWVLLMTPFHSIGNVYMLRFQKWV